VTYNIDGGSNQTLTLDAITGKKELNPVLLTTTVYNLVSVTLGCTQLFSNSVTITVNPLPTASILGTATVCSGVSTDITFTGTPNASVVYKINNGLDQTILLDTTGTAILPVTLTNTATYSLVSVTSFSSLSLKPPSYDKKTDKYKGLF
jgi:hypothetical protein